MKGDGDFLSLGSHGSQSASSSRSGSESGSEREWERKREREGFSGTHGDESSSSLVLSSLSRNGRSMLAGGCNGGFSLKPPGVGNLMSLRNFAMGLGIAGGNNDDRGTTVTGGGFTGFYRKSATSTTRPSLLLPGTTKLRLFPAHDDTENAKDDDALVAASSSHRCATGIAGKGDNHPLKTDVENLTPDECWRLILKLGSRWPAWNGATTTTTTTTTTASQAPQGVMKERSSVKDERHSLQLGQDTLKLLATRALEALAQAPDQQQQQQQQHCRGNMQAPKRTTQEITPPKPKAARDPPSPASKSTQQPTVATVVQQPSLLAKVPIYSSRNMAAPKVTTSESRTAPLTIFYAGTVNVCNNVPEDKARLIMLFAEKAGVNPNALTEDASPGETGRAQEELVQQKQQLSKPSSSAEVMLATETLVSAPSPLAPSSAHHAEGSSSDPQKPPLESSTSPAEPAEPSPLPLKITISECKSRQRPRLQGTAKPLPNARKNSLARFLDSRKRNRSTASCSEGQASKKPALGPAGSDGCPSDAEDMMKGIGKSLMPLCSQSSTDSKEGLCAYDRAEMKDSLKS